MWWLLWAASFAMGFGTEMLGSRDLLVEEEEPCPRYCAMPGDRIHRLRDDMVGFAKAAGLERQLAAPPEISAHLRHSDKRMTAFPGCGSSRSCWTVVLLK
jgi:hypothetical protein